jgi:hypothetical protein
MKTLFSLLGILFLLSYPSRLFSQCAGPALPFTITYDSIVTGIGNSSRLFTFHKFDPSLGTLLSADLKSVSKLQYSYTLMNIDPIVTHTYRTQIIRTDDISSTALDPSTISETTNSSPVLAILAAGQHTDVGPKSLNYTINNSVTDSRLINFEGTGSVDLDYEIGTSAFTTLSTLYNFSFTTAVDTVDFSITYRYCSNSLLSSDLLFFTAVPQSKNNVLLNWRQANVEAGRMYNVQLSTDGITFTALADVAENTTGAYAYNYLNSSAKKLFFRIQEKNVSGEIKYSNIRMVEFNQDTKAVVHIFPTLYTGGSLQVNFPERSDWQITLFASDGRKISENRMSNVNAVSLPVPGQLGNGIYLVETFNTFSQQRQVTRIIVQR